MLPAIAALARVALPKVAKVATAKNAKRAAGREVSKLTKRTMVEDIRNMTRNLDRRLTRIERNGIASEVATQARQALDAMARQQLNQLGVNELRRVYTVFRDLEAHKGTYATGQKSWKTVEAKQQKYRAAKQRRDYLDTKAGTQRGISSMTKDELLEYRDILRKRIQDKARRTEREVGGDTHAIRKWREFLDDNTLDGNVSQFDLRYQVSEMRKIDRYEGMTPAGARRQQGRVVSTFGTGIAKYSPKEQSALIDEMHRQMQIHGVGSPEAYAYVVAQVNRTRSLPDGSTASVNHSFWNDSHGNLRVSFAGFDNSADEKAFKDRRLDELASYYERNTMAVWRG